MKLVNTKSALTALALAFGLFAGVSNAQAQDRHFHGNLTHFDRLWHGKHYDVYKVRMVKGCHYHIRLNSNCFDTYLYVLDCHRVLARNDDGGPGLNSYLRFCPPCTGWYYIRVTSYAPEQTGHYHLDVIHH